MINTFFCPPRYALAIHVDNPCVDLHGWLAVLAQATREEYKCNYNNITGKWKPEQNTGEL